MHFRTALNESLLFCMLYDESMVRVLSSFPPLLKALFLFDSHCFKLGDANYIVIAASL